VRDVKPKAQEPKVQEPKVKSKLLADSREPAEAVPVAVEPVEGRVPPAAEPVEKDHEAETGAVLPALAERHDRELALNFGVLRPEGEELRRVRGAQAALVELLEHVLGRDVPSEVDELDCHLLDAFPLLRKVRIGDVVVVPVVLTGRDELLDRRAALVRDSDGVGVGSGRCGSGRLGLLGGRRRDADEHAERFAEGTLQVLAAVVHAVEQGLGIDARERLGERAGDARVDLGELAEREGGSMSHGCSFLAAGWLSAAFEAGTLRQKPHST
jgi:hypothetical protein